MVNKLTNKKSMELIGKEFSKTEYNVMTVTSRCGSINRTYKIEELDSSGYFKCRVIKSESWHYPGSTWNGDPIYDRNEFHSFEEWELNELTNKN